MKIFLTFIFCCLIAVVVVICWPLSRQEQSPPTITVRLNNLVYALNQARENLGAYPTGSWQQVSAVLNGGNIKKLRFIEGIKTNQVGEFLDIWGTPYAYEVGSNLSIKSAGPDRIFGSQDDQSASLPR